MSVNVIKVFDGQSADGNSTEFSLNGVRGYDGVKPIIQIKGTFGGGLIKLQKEDLTTSGQWGDTGDEVTDEDVSAYEIDPKGKYRLNLSGATTPSIDAWVVGGGV